MNPSKRLCQLLSLLLIAVASTAWATELVDYLGISGPIELAGQTYQLAWTSRLSANYVRQEYLPQGEALDNYHHMILIDRVGGTDDTAHVLGGLYGKLKAMKKKDDFVNFEVLQGPDGSGEYILDFILRTRENDGRAVIEWNAYRYAPTRDAQGNPAVLLFGVSYRAYDNERMDFMQHLDDLRGRVRLALAQAPMPAPQR